MAGPAYFTKVQTFMDKCLKGFDNIPIHIEAHTENDDQNKKQK